MNKVIEIIDLLDDADYIYGGEDYVITDNDIELLKQGKIINFDVNGEYGCTLRYEPNTIAEQEPCEDCISREYLLSIANKDKFYGCVSARDIINAPSVTPQEPKTGHWVKAKVGKLFVSNDYKCSECGNILDFGGVNCGRGDANYCPNCGAIMVELPKESEG